MKNWQNYFKDKKITVMGLGLLGRGIADARFLVEAGAKVIVTDLKTREELKPALEQLKDLDIKYVLGEHHEEDFTDVDFILKNAAVPPYSKFLQLARENNIPIEMDESLFAKFKADTIDLIGITGTRGKTTTSYIIYEILKELLNRPVYLAGNIQGKATLPLLKEIEENAVVILELSSWQLQGFAEDKISPDIAVWTNLYPDHLNYYKGSMEDYADDKKNIYRYQTEEDVYIYNKKDKFLVDNVDEVKSKKIAFSFLDIPKDWKLKIIGQHNLENIAAALKVAELYNLDLAKVQNVVENFIGVEYRLQFVAEKSGVKFYNDTTSTTPIAGLKALHAFEDNENIILIAGGADKDLDLREWVEYMITRVKKLILLKGTGTEKIKEILKELGKLDLITAEYDDFTASIEAAYALAEEGDIVLLSPACASFGMFKNEYHRGEEFNRIVNDLNID